MSAILKNGREKRRRHFPNHAPKKVVKRAKVVFRPEKLAANHTGFATFTAFFPVALEKCQFLATLPSVDGSENITRLIMIQGILSQPMILLSAGVDELTLMDKTQMAIGIEAGCNSQCIGRHTNFQCHFDCLGSILSGL